MTAFSTIGRPVADWLLQSAGYNTTLTRLTDRSPVGSNHLVRTGAAPTFTTHSSIPGMVMGVANTSFAAPAFLPAPVTFISVAHILLDAAESLGLMRAIPESYSGNTGQAFAAGDPAWETKDTSNYFLGASKFISFALVGSDTTFRVLMRDSISTLASANAAYTNSAWQVVQGVIDPVNLLLKARVNTGTIVTAPITDSHFPMYPSETAYVDPETTGITTSGGKHVTIARQAVFNGDLFTDNLSGLNTVVAELLVDPAAPGP